MNGPDQRPDRVLVMGWGFIGAAVGHRLHQGATPVAGLSRSHSPRTRHAQAAGIDVVIGDATDASIVDRALDGVTHVVYAAGGLLPPAAAASPVEDATSTLAPLITVLERVSRRAHVGFTYISSGGTVYGNPARTPVGEAEVAKPISPYGVSRLAGEWYAQMYERSAGMPVQVVRCANVYGPGQPDDRSQGAVAIFLSRVAAGLPLTIVGDGSAVRDYVYVDDVGDVLARLALQPVGGVINLGSGRATSVSELVDLVSDTVGRPALREMRPSRPHDVTSIVLDITRLRSLLDYHPVDLPDGLRRTWEARGHHTAVATPAARAVT